MLIFLIYQISLHILCMLAISKVYCMGQTIKPYYHIPVVKSFVNGNFLYKSSNYETIQLNIILYAK